MTNFTYHATVRDWVDGDTVDLTVVLDERNIDFGFRIKEHRLLTVDDRFRLVHIDTPERGKPNYKEATAFAAAMAPIGSGVTITTYKPLQDKYGRWLTEVEPEPVTLTPDGLPISVNQALLTAKLALPYEGGSKLLEQP